MRTTIANLSNEALEQNIANIYWSAAKQAPGVALKESGNLGLLWEEFDYRYQEDTISDDTDWTERQDWE